MIQYAYIEYIIYMKKTKKIRESYALQEAPKAYASSRYLLSRLRPLLRKIMSQFNVYKNFYGTYTIKNSLKLYTNVERK